MFRYRKDQEPRQASPGKNEKKKVPPEHQISTRSRLCPLFPAYAVFPSFIPVKKNPPAKKGVNHVAEMRTSRKFFGEWGAG
jgi:hypothetical protein